MPAEPPRPPPSRPRGRAALFVAALAAAGCSGAYRSLPSDRQIPALAARLDAAATIPRRTFMVPVTTSAGEPVRMAVTEVGSGTRSRVVVLVHGVLSDSETWRYLVADVAKDADVLLLDLPGCGASDAPDPAVIGREAYSPTALAKYVLLALADRCGAHPSWAHTTLVGHSLGSAVALRLLAAPELSAVAPKALARIDAAVLLACLDYAMAKPDPTFLRIAHLTPLEAKIGGACGLLHGNASKCLLACGYGDGCAPREEADRTVAALTSPTRLRAGQAMIVEAVPFGCDERPDWPRVEALVADYARVSVPCLLVHGGRDETIPVSTAYKVRDQLPRAWLRLLSTATHSLPTERPGECAEMVRRFSAERGAGWPAIATWPEKPREPGPSCGGPRCSTSASPR